MGIGSKTTTNETIRGKREVLRERGRVMGLTGNKIREENQGRGGGQEDSQHVRRDGGENQQRQILLENAIMKPNVMYDNLKMVS